MPELKLELRNPETGEVQPLRELERAEALAVLTHGEIVAAELVPWGSNHTFAVAIQHENEQHLGIYKPTAGERPLHDFPFGTLANREMASWLLSDGLGWDIVPPTVLRDGPYGEGSVQIFVPHIAEFDGDEEYWGADGIANERIVLFDHIANNADRKLTHCLVSASGKPFGIDHGLTFHAEPKLRTVMWQFVEEPIHPDLLGDLRRFLEEDHAELKALLNKEEWEAFINRIDILVEQQRYPALDPRFNIPYGWW
ncbi:MAG: hypothetical protein KC435_13015 [Thermomicrobiales bacterium]|nr:hypothetical protein [Thermomicrobiales bacterium]